MFLLDTLIYFVIGVCVLFFLLGLQSQKGKAKGLVDGRLAPPGKAPNCATSENHGQDQKPVEPLQTDMQKAKAAIIKTGGVITSETDSYVSATYMSKLFKFVDDVELRDAGDGTVHIRSASRVGYSDRGVNRKRIEIIRAAL